MSTSEVRVPHGRRSRLSLGTPWTRVAPALALCLLLVQAACEREKRHFREVPPGAAAVGGRTTSLVPGPPVAEVGPAAYQESRWAVSQGQMLYMQFNCAGCHSPGGGGGMGPPLIDDHWIYGSEPQQIFSTIVEGRPNGMPAFQGRIAAAQVWQLVAYVRTLGGLTPPDTWPSRQDHQAETTPARSVPGRPPPASP